MTRTFQRFIVGGVATMVVAVAGVVVAQPVREVVALRVNNPAVLLAAYDRLHESAVMDDVKSVVLAAPVDGSNPATHYVVIEWNDYNAWEAAIGRYRASRDWQTFVNTITDAAELLGTTLHVERFARGSDWRQFDAAVAFNMTISDPGTFLAALAELAESVGHPGSARLDEIRAGGMGSTHILSLFGESLAAANEYLDEAFASEAFRTYTSKVGDIRTINNVSLLSRLRTYN